MQLTFRGRINAIAHMIIINSILNTVYTENSYININYVHGFRGTRIIEKFFIFLIR